MSGCDTAWTRIRVSVVTPLALRCSALDRCTTREPSYLMHYCLIDYNLELESISILIGSISECVCSKKQNYSLQFRLCALSRYGFLKQSGEQFLCSAPNTTSCGHNFCMVCITKYWGSKDLYQCSLSQEKFYRRPKLCVNTTYKEVVENFKRMRDKGKDETRKCAL